MKTKLLNITILVMIVWLLPLTGISQNIEKSDSVLVHVEDLRTTIKIFSEYENVLAKQVYYEKLVSKYDVLISTNTDIENQYKLVVSTLELTNKTQSDMYDTQLKRYKEKLRKANIRFTISTASTILLIIILL